MADEAFKELVRNTYRICSTFLRDEMGEIPEGRVIKVGRAVVWARYYRGDDGWEKLKAAIGELEALVGRPADETEI
jgi:hypothetical protein